MPKCPVCNRKLVQTYRIFDFGLECESVEECRCGYCYEFSYGASREIFGPFTAYSTLQRRVYLLLWQLWTFDGCIVQEVPTAP